MPRARFGEGEYYHVYNRGVDKRAIYLDDKDYWRFLTLLVILQGDIAFNHVDRLIHNVQHRMFDNEMFDNEYFKDVLKWRYVELVNFCLMPNHFHLILREIKEGGISKFMQRLLDAYTKYFNIKHKRSGHLFTGKFQAIHIDRNEYLNYLSAYIHLNPRELSGWRGKEIAYPWSSFQDLAGSNRFGRFLTPSVILDQFGNGTEYRSFVEETPAKKIKEEFLSEEYCID